MDAEPAAVTDRTLLLGDSHGRLSMLREALRVAQQLGCARIVSVGDFGVWPGSSGKQFLDQVDRMAESRDVDVLVVPGNHEDYDQLALADVDAAGWMVLRDRVRAAHRGQVAVFGRFRWLLCGGATSIDGPGGVWSQNRGPLDAEALVPDGRGGRVLRQAGHDLGGWWPQERLTAADVAACAEAGQVDVLVTHEAPSEVPLVDSHKPVDPAEWPMGARQREMVSEIRAASSPPLGFAGHWHQHALLRDDAGLYVVLSADAVPDEVQWAVVEDDGVSDVPRLLLPAVWGSSLQLTALGPKGHVVSKHRVVSDLGDRDLVEVASGPPEPYRWPDA